MEVQRALQEAQMAFAAAPTQKDSEAWSEEALRVDLLREELMNMLSAARRRKSVVEGVSMDFEVLIKLTARARLLVGKFPYLTDRISFSNY